MGLSENGNGTKRKKRHRRQANQNRCSPERILNETQHRDLHDFMSQISHEMESEYQRIRRRTPEDPGAAGDQGEQNWAELLKEWLPTTYYVVTKGRLIGYQTEVSRQVDVIVLKPSYPRRLRSTKLYLAAGVAAAFECKTTLKPEHIKVLYLALLIASYELQSFTGSSLIRMIGKARAPILFPTSTTPSVLTTKS
jgi:hypothetical protein